MSARTIIVATPNATQRSQIASLVDSLAGFNVIAQTGDLMNTYNLVESRLPSAVLISDSLARLPEFEVMHALFSSLDVRWLVLTAPDTAHRAANTNTPGSDLFSVPGHSSAEVIEGQLRSLTRYGRHRAPVMRSSLHNSLTKQTAQLRTVDSAPTHAARSATSSSGLPKTTPIILIGASTGGIDALLTVLRNFPVDCPPTLIVQHTGIGFGESLAALLDRQCAPTVVLAKDKQPLQRGAITIGAGNKSHLVLEGGPALYANCRTGPPVSGHVPSVDMLFSSGVDHANRISAAILTGMGKDGAQGLLKLRQAGALTVAQDEASSVVFGMPRAAIEIGAAQQTLPIDKIGPALLNGQGRSKQPRKVLP